MRKRFHCKTLHTSILIGKTVRVRRFYMANIKLRTFKEISTQTAVFKMDIRHSILQGVCRHISCPLFHIRKGQTCQQAYTTFDNQPKTAIIRFHQLNKTIKYQDPYINFENDIAPIVESDIWTMIPYENKTYSVYNPSNFHNHWQYYNFYQKQGENESDFILEFTWMSLVPDFFKQPFYPITVSIPIPRTTTLFEATLFTSFDIQEDNITIHRVTYVRILNKTLNVQLDMFSYITRYLEMPPCIICNQVSLPLSSLTISDNSFYRNSNGIAVALPYHYIVTSSFLEMCADYQ